MRQFFIGEFEAKLNKADIKWLLEDVEDTMLLRKDEKTSE